MKRRSTRWGIGLIFTSVMVSCILALAVNWDHNELGVFYNIFLPPLGGGVSILLFLIPNAISKYPKIQLISVIVFCLINLSIGIMFHFELGCFPYRQ